MENKKNLEINTAICDVRHVTEELLSAYEKVEINAATIITAPAAQVLLSRLEINCANTITLEENVRFSTINGPLSITAGQAVPEEKLFLVVNGPVDIETGCEEVLKSYAGMSINGPVTCSESMAGLLGSFSINGPVRTYPDGAIRLKSRTKLDRIFHLRAKRDALYYAASKITALSPDIDFGKLAEKNVRFVTKKLLVSESLVEAALPLFDEKTDIVVLPDGCAYVDDDAELDASLLKRYGGKLYVNGDLTIGPDSAGLLDQVSFLRTGGDLLVCRSLRDRVLAMDAEYDHLYVVGSTLITGRAQAEVSAAMLETAEEGVSVISCANVVIAEDISPELLKEKLVSVVSCATVQCTGEQRPVVEALAEDVAAVYCGGGCDEDEDPSGDENTVQINAAFYTL